MAGKMKLPVGLESFKQIRRENYYYVDKTGLIAKLLDLGSAVNLFPRPRRFGKSLNMSMLQSFFELGCDRILFEGLNIAGKMDLCEQYMGKYPVISVSLKGVDGSTFEAARAALKIIIGNEAMRFSFLKQSEQLTLEEKQIYEKLIEIGQAGNDMYAMSEDLLTASLKLLSALLKKHYGIPVILLVDEYDVPLDRAFQNGYYDEMVSLIRGLMGNALKTNENLKFAVLTGCLRIAKESIFTGLNNFKVYPFTNPAFDEFFGFTDKEVVAMLHYYDLDEHYETVKSWYDGYQFGNTEIYCPWDVINYCGDHRLEPDLPPQNYWINTSGNTILRHFIEEMGTEKKLTKLELESLISGDTVQKEINQELTYQDLYSSMDNLWSTLFMTGYLTQRGKSDGNRYNLAIPNREVREIMIRQVLELFQESVEQDGGMVNKFCNALLCGNPETVESVLTEYLKKTISVCDTFVRKPAKENFYHGILLGILSFKGGWSVRSNQESGDGFSDISIRIDDADLGIVIEVKYAEPGREEQECQKALRQIIDKQYEESLRQDGIHKILKYGIACNRKKCRVVMATEKIRI